MNTRRGDGASPTRSPLSFCMAQQGSHVARTLCVRFMYAVRPQYICCMYFCMYTLWTLYVRCTRAVKTLFVSCLLRTRDAAGLFRAQCTSWCVHRARSTACALCICCIHIYVLYTRRVCNPTAPSSPSTVCTLCICCVLKAARTFFEPLAIRGTTSAKNSSLLCSDDKGEWRGWGVGEERAVSGR
jgi:hypothetical protein